MNDITALGEPIYHTFFSKLINTLTELLSGTVAERDGKMKTVMKANEILKM